MPIRRRRNPKGDILLSKTITLTDAQIKALPTANSAIEIVAAPGAGKIIVPIHSVWILNNTAGVYTNTQASTAPSGCALYLVWDALNNFNDASGYIQANNFLHNSAGIFISNVGPISGNLLNVDPTSGDELAFPGDTTLGYKNAALYVTGQNDFPANLGNFTGGNAANTLKVTVWYDIVTL